MINDESLKCSRHLFAENWGNIFHNLTRLIKISKKYKINTMYVDGNKLAYLSNDLYRLKDVELFECIQNRNIV